MSAPFYVSPEQWYQDKAEYAAKGISQGKPIVAIDYQDGVVMLAENASSTLRKISEIYDRIAFAGVGKFDEYENLRKSGVRYADFKGFSYCREDVAARSLANEYSTLLGNIFTREMKPFEVELLVAEIADEPGAATFYRILFNGIVIDHRKYAAIGGEADDLRKVLEQGWREGMSLHDAVELGRRALRDASSATALDESNLEIGILDRQRDGRKFRRLGVDEIRGLITE